jgi:hypothetical protein
VRHGGCVCAVRTLLQIVHNNHYLLKQISFPLTVLVTTQDIYCRNTWSPDNLTQSPQEIQVSAQK